MKYYDVRQQRKGLTRTTVVSHDKGQVLFKGTVSRGTSILRDADGSPVCRVTRLRSFNILVLATDAKGACLFLAKAIPRAKEVEIYLDKDQRQLEFIARVPSWSTAEYNVVDSQGNFLMSVESVPPLCCVAPHSEHSIQASEKLSALKTTALDVVINNIRKIVQASRVSSGATAVNVAVTAGAVSAASGGGAVAGGSC